MIKMVAFDLDGTLLDSSRSISRQNARSIRLAVEAGIVVVLASGRNVESIRGFWRDLGLQGPIVSCNGAYVLDAQGQELHHAAVEDGIRDELLVYAKEEGTAVTVYSRSRVLSGHRTAWSDLYAERLRNLVPEAVSGDELSRHEATKVLYCDAPERIREHRDRMWDTYSPQTYMTISEPEYLEFMALGVDKAHGLAILAKTLGIQREEVAAIGDYWNDLEMVRWAGFGGAPANAIDDVKAAADRVFASNDEAGASQFLDWIVYNRR